MDPVEEVDVDSYMRYVEEDIVTGYSGLGYGDHESVTAHGGISLNVESLPLAQDLYVDESGSDLAGYVPAPYIDQPIDQPFNQPLPPSRRSEGPVDDGLSHLRTLPPIRVQNRLVKRPFGPKGLVLEANSSGIFGGDRAYSPVLSEEQLDGTDAMVVETIKKKLIEPFIERTHMDYFYDMCGMKEISLAERRRRPDLQGMALMSASAAVLEQRHILALTQYMEGRTQEKERRQVWEKENADIPDATVSDGASVVYDLYSDDIGHADESAGGEQSAIANQETMLTSSSVSIPTMDEPTQLPEDPDMTEWDDESVVDMLYIDDADPVGPVVQSDDVPPTNELASAVSATVALSVCRETPTFLSEDMATVSLEDVAVGRVLRSRPNSVHPTYEMLGNRKHWLPSVKAKSGEGNTDGA